jgi:hypothetical protein
LFRRDDRSPHRLRDEPGHRQARTILRVGVRRNRDGPGRRKADDRSDRPRARQCAPALCVGTRTRHGARVGTTEPALAGERHRRPDRERFRDAGWAGVHHTWHPVAHELRGAAGLGARATRSGTSPRSTRSRRCRSSSSGRLAWLPR